MCLNASLEEGWLADSIWQKHSQNSEGKMKKRRANQ